MKRNMGMVAAALGVLISGGIAHAGWAQVGSYGYQPCWGVFAHREKPTPANMDSRRGTWHDQLGIPMSPYVPTSRYVPSPVNPAMQFAVPRGEIAEPRILLVDGPGGY
ncbi:MAG TPA: hypothetical protein VGG61_05720 [Gemmataceae bacterium]|jgi:hypothetical protein